MTTPYQAFPPALMILSPRLTKAGDPGASVVGLSTTPLADGAILYCIENQTPYRLDKQSSAAPDGNLVLAPLYGPGRWLADVAPTPTTPVGGIVQLLDDIGGGFYSVASPNYVALGGSTNYGFQGSGFTLNTTGCILTYTGTTPKTFLVIGDASNSTPFAAALGSWGIAKNGDLIGQPILGGATGPAGCCLQNFDDTNNQEMTSTQRRVTLATGDTIQPVGGTAGGTVNMDMTTMTISVQECA